MSRAQKNTRLAATLWAVPLGLVALLASRPVAASAAATTNKPAGSPETKRAIADIRNVGTAMFSWYTEQKSSSKGKAEGAAMHEEPKAVDLTGIPVISYDDLKNLLVPKYLKSLPRNDPWGHPYEYRLNTQNPDAPQIMAVRSAGADGNFSADTYEIGPFAAADHNHDLVWSDGYFVTWPGPHGK